MDGSWHEGRTEEPAVQLFFKHVWCPVTGCQRSSCKLKVKWAGMELKLGAANYKMHLILGRLLSVHVSCGREILEDGVDWHSKHGKWLWGVQINDKRHKRMAPRILNHCRILPCIWAWRVHHVQGMKCCTKKTLKTPYVYFSGDWRCKYGVNIYSSWM